MRFLITQKDIENAQQQLCMSLSHKCTQQIPVSLGFQGGHIDCTINWSPTFGLWFHSGELETRYWNVFGLSDVAPKKNSMLPIIVEINPPVKGLNRQVQGAFVLNENDELTLVHRGKIGGGKPGVGRKLFFENYQGETRNTNGRKVVILGDINSPDFVRKIKSFVQEVARIKALV